MIHLLDVSCQGHIVTRVWPLWPAPDTDFLKFAIAEIVQSRLSDGSISTLGLARIRIIF